MGSSYISAVEDKNFVVVWERDTNGVLEEVEHPIEDFIYTFMLDNSGKETKYTDIFGRPVKQVFFDTKRDLRKFAEIRDTLFESDVPILYKCLLDRYANADVDAPYNVLMYDIEVDYDLADGNGYPTPANPFGEVNTFQGWDSCKQQYILFCQQNHTYDLTQLKDTEYPVHIREFINERALLDGIAEYIRHVDIMIGWYTNGFDLPYIMARALKLFPEDEALRMFCRGGFPAKCREFIDDSGRDCVEWTLIGRQHLDMMELYKKFIPGEKTSFSLDAVCEEDLGENKVNYDGDLGDLFRENPALYFSYALHDARLLKKLDEKHQIVKLAMFLARLNCVFPADVKGSVKPIETGFIKFCHERGIVVPDKTHKDAEDFPGAIVYDTIEGRHGWVATVDLTALYPSVMIMLGLSTETLVGQLRNGFDDYVEVISKSNRMLTFFPEDGEPVSIAAFELEQILREEGMTISANGTVFSGKLGLLSEYVQERFALRKLWQRKKAEFEKAGDKAQASTADLFQKVFKIVCNSLYGCISNAHFRLFDIRMAKSITISGQIISKHQARFANELLRKSV